MGNDHFPQEDHGKVCLINQIQFVSNDTDLFVNPMFMLLECMLANLIVTIRYIMCVMYV